MFQNFGLNELRSLLPLVAVVGFLSPQFFLLGTIKPTQKRERVASYSQHTLNDFSLKSYKDGLKRWELKADQAQNNSKQIWTLNNVDGLYYGADAQIKILSQSGSLEPNKNFLKLMENVKAKSTKGYSFNTDEIIVFESDEGQRFFETEDKVHLFNKAQKIDVHAVGLKGLVETGEVELLNKVSCKKKLKKYSDVLIESDRAEISSSLKSIKFKDNLSITQEKMKIKGEEAYFHYNERRGDLESVRINGEILASDGIKTAMSESVEMRLFDDVIIFQGSPRIRMGKNEMVGEEILITNNQKNVQVRRGNIKTEKKGMDLEDE